MAKPESRALLIQARLQKLMHAHRIVVLEDRYLARECGAVFNELEQLNMALIDVNQLIKERSTEHSDNRQAIDEQRRLSDQLRCESIRLHQQLKRLRKKYASSENIAITGEGGASSGSGDTDAGTANTAAAQQAPKSRPLAAKYEESATIREQLLMKTVKLKLLQQCTGLMVASDPAADAAAAAADPSDAAAGVVGLIKCAGDTELRPFRLDKVAGGAERVERELWQTMKGSCDPVIYGEFERMFAAGAAVKAVETTT